MSEYVLNQYFNLRYLLKIIDKYNVSIFYTAPTAIRTLMRAGDDFLRSSSRASLRLLGSVGEPIDPDAWRWLHDKIGGGRCQLSLEVDHAVIRAEGRFVQAFTERWMGVYGPGDVFGRGVKGHRQYCFCDQLRGLRPNDMHA